MRSAERVKCQTTPRSRGHHSLQKSLECRRDKAKARGTVHAMRTLHLRNQATIGSSALASARTLRKLLVSVDATEHHQSGPPHGPSELWVCPLQLRWSRRIVSWLFRRGGSNIVVSMPIALTLRPTRPFVRYVVALHRCTMTRDYGRQLCGGGVNTLLRTNHAPTLLPNRCPLVLACECNGS